MIKICFVCHGNICRSPMAEFIMKKLVKDEGLEKEFYIVSRATHTDEIWNGTGSRIYLPAQQELERRSVPFSYEKRATLLNKSDYNTYDYFIGMDKENIRYMHRILGSDRDNKIYRLLDFTEYGGNVADPWYTGNFENAYNDIVSGCRALLEKIIK